MSCPLRHVRARCTAVPVWVALAHLATMSAGCESLPRSVADGEPCLRSLQCAPGLACVEGRCSADLGPLAEAGMPVVPDSGPPDGGLEPDGGTFDAGPPPDGGVVDGGIPDGGSADGGGDADGGASDAGPPPVDGGAPGDAGADAGRGPDAGGEPDAGSELDAG